MSAVQNEWNFPVADYRETSSYIAGDLGYLLETHSDNLDKDQIALLTNAMCELQKISNS